MTELLENFKNKKPEIVFEWNDSETNATGWIVINSLRGGAAGGGTRMRLGLSKDEVISLSKVMEVKFSVCGPNIGGAKSGINFDPNDPRRTDVLKRWYQAIIPILKTYYGTGGDLNVDELKDVIPITEDLGLWHPQEGIVNGHLKCNDGDKVNILGQLRYGCAKIVEDVDFVPSNSKKYAVADMITGYGVSESVKHFYDIFHQQNLEGKRVIIQGWGNVASAAGFYLSKQGAKIVGIIDRSGGVIKNEGFSFSEIEKMFLDKKNNQLIHNDLMSFEEVNARIWDVPCDIFIPGAASKIVTSEQASRLKNNGIKVISCGANVPFSDDNIFFGETANNLDSHISLVPDFIANCGMARVFAYLMQKDCEMTDKGIFFDVSMTIKNALKKIHEMDNSGLKLSRNALKIALDKLNNC
ncbi:MAG: Glu/Leu/Phe/Val dehydrogenase [Saprospiraceae bacterium]|nr:Glu/Leu/Phe/Val dehydrogenase [Saprospiraceae bacterium]